MILEVVLLLIFIVLTFFNYIMAKNILVFFILSKVFKFDEIMYLYKVGEINKEELEEYLKEIKEELNKDLKKKIIESLTFKEFLKIIAKSMIPLLLVELIIGFATYFVADYIFAIKEISSYFMLSTVIVFLIILSLNIGYVLAILNVSSILLNKEKLNNYLETIFYYYSKRIKK